MEVASCESLGRRLPPVYVVARGIRTPVFGDGVDAQVTQDHLDTLDVDGDGLPRLLGRIAPPQAASGSTGTA